MNISVTSRSIVDAQSEGYIFFVPEGIKIDQNKALARLAGTVAPHLSDLCKAYSFSGSSLSTFSLPLVVGTQRAHIILVGVGSKEGSYIPVERYRRAVGKAIRIAQQYKLKTISVQVPDAQSLKLTNERLGQETVCTIAMTDYAFDEFITDKKRKAHRIDAVTLCASSAAAAGLKKGAARGKLIGKAVNTARHWVNLPANKLVPTDVAEHAKKIAAESGLTAQVFTGAQVKKMGFGGLEAVAKGSTQDCRFVVLEYVARKKTAPTIALVGKGITFDSGGLSLKPPQYMETMKEDMAGAAAVINAMGVIGKLKPKVNVVGLTPLTENLPSGTATKPGDIITFYNGKTAEVLNTDAEGRLVLADALSYAVKHYKPALVIDLATLTGAVAYALGPGYAGLLSNQNKMVDRVEKAGKSSGDLVWRLPLPDDYGHAIESPYADISNICLKNQYKPGTITAALFLSHFVDDTPWVHVDIADTAFNAPNKSYYTPGGTGVGVRLLVDLIEQW